jgi:hypothetical protein
VTKSKPIPDCKVPFTHWPKRKPSLAELDAREAELSLALQRRLREEFYERQARKEAA